MTESSRGTERREAPDTHTGALLDLNVSIGHYPFRRLPFDSSDPGAVKARLQQCGIQQACAGSLNAVFYGDPQQGNADVLPNLAGDPFFLPVGVVNPSLQNWRETLARCADEYGCPMIRLYPSYHGYRLTDRAVEELLAAAAERSMTVAVVQRLEDERMHHPLMPVPAGDLYDIMGTAQRFNKPLLLLSAYLAEIQQLAPMTPNLYFDIAFAESMDTLATLTTSASVARLVLGTHVPLLYPEAAVGKVAAWQCSAGDQAAVYGGNARRLLGLDLPDDAHQTGAAGTQGGPA